MSVAPPSLGRYNHGAGPSGFLRGVSQESHAVCPMDEKRLEYVRKDLEDGLCLHPRLYHPFAFGGTIDCLFYISVCDFSISVCESNA